MAAKTQLSLECDLCHWPAKAFADNAAAKNAGWREVSIEDYFVDRMWSEKWICPSCAKKIAGVKGST